MKYCCFILLMIALNCSAQDSLFLLRVMENNKIGFINTSGKTVIPFIYNNAGEFSEGISGGRQQIKTKRPS